MALRRDDQQGEKDVQMEHVGFSSHLPKVAHETSIIWCQETRTILKYLVSFSRFSNTKATEFEHDCTHLNKSKIILIDPTLLQYVYSYSEGFFFSSLIYMVIS